MMWRARGIQSVRSPWMRCPITSYGDQVPVPSVAAIHLSGKSLSNAVRLRGVRSRIATASSSLNVSSLIKGILLAEDSEAHVSIGSSGRTAELTRRREFNQASPDQFMMRNTLPPRASNDLLCRDFYSRAFVDACQATTCHLPERRTYTFVKRQSSSRLLPLTVRVR